MDPGAEPNGNDNGELQRAAIERELADKLRGHREYLKGFSEPETSNLAPSETATEALTTSNGFASQPSITSPEPPSEVPQSVSNDNDPHAPMAAAEAAATTTQPVTLDGQMAEEQQLEPDVRRIPRPPRQLRRSASDASSEDDLTNVYV